MEKKYTHLTPEMRSEIYLLHAEGKSLSKIAQFLGVHKSTISREMSRNSDPGILTYLPDKAHVFAQSRRNRPGSKIKRSKPLQDIIVDHIVMGWSPEIIAGRLKTEQVEHTISHESIYKWIYGEGKKYELIQYLVRKKRRRGKRPTRKIEKWALPNRVSIHERPPEFAIQFGHWEGDLIIFAGNKGAILTLYERMSKVILGQKIPQKTAEIVTAAIENQIQNLPEISRKSMTFDNGREFSNHKSLHPLLDDQTYFCDPYASWQKGGVENGNGIIRRDVPKGARAKDYTDDDIQLILNDINNTPRKSLGFLTPIEKFNALCSNSEPLLSNFFNTVALQL